MIQIQNTTLVSIPTYHDANQAFETGIKSRKVFSTEYNDVSSRSHMIFTVII